ncbi:cd63 antigen [Branchiostoma belcheri]|nr:cd63 antigen [Branchiostoma belcheri]
MDKTQRLKERTGYAQIVLIAFVVFLLLPGAALVIAGAWMIFHMSWTEILTPGRSAKTESVLTCVGGALTVILAAIIVHAHRDLRWFRQGVTMREIGIFLVVIVMLEFAVATTCTVRENIPTGQLGIELNRTLQAVKRNVSRAPDAEWARLQTSTDCCGIWNFTDWINLKADNGSNINGSSSFPESCKCRATSGNDCHRTSDGNVWKRPCLRPYLGVLQQQYNIIRIANAVAIVVQVGSFLLFLCEGFRLHQESKVGVYVADPPDNRQGDERTEEQTVV